MQVSSERNFSSAAGRACVKPQTLYGDGNCLLQVILQAGQREKREGGKGGGLGLCALCRGEKEREGELVSWLVGVLRENTPKP